MDSINCHLVFQHHLANIQIFISQNGGRIKGDSWYCTANQESSFKLVDDYGPSSMAWTPGFVEHLDSQITICIEKGCLNLVFCADVGSKSLNHAAYLLGSYLILTTEETPDEVAQRFADIDPDLLEDFRDPSSASEDISMNLRDCWGGLYRGKQLGWIGMRDAESGLWGLFDKEAYVHCSHPLNGDFHEIVPERLIAFNGPRDLGGAPYEDRAGGSRIFGPKYVASLLHEMDVAAVIRLNAAEYDRTAFLEAGIMHHDLYYEDGTAPSRELVAKFLRILDSEQGIIAVHCTSGRGRSGTLIALYLMLKHRFAAAQAVAWVRIMRPGSILGLQQDYLLRLDAVVSGSSPRPTPSPGWAQGGFSRSLSRLAAATADGPLLGRCSSLDE
jgi:cell division cycle 14